jgi:hypothetical protein
LIVTVITMGMMQLVGYEVIDMVAALPGETEC